MKQSIAEQRVDRCDGKSTSCPVSVLIPTKNDGRNLEKCLMAIRGWAGEIVVVDSHSTDQTAEIATRYGANVLQFTYDGGWPKKRNWAIDTHPWKHGWLLLLDADEEVPAALREEISQIISDPKSCDGYWVGLVPFFLGKPLKFGDSSLRKLSLFKQGKGRYERRLDRDDSGFDMEVHEHVVVDGSVAETRNKLIHHNVNSLTEYIDKHNRYSSWEAAVFMQAMPGGLQPSPFGNQAQRRRWIKRFIMSTPGAPILMFLYTYIGRLGFLDGRAGLTFAGFRMVQWFHIRAKIHERRLSHATPERAPKSIS